MPLKLYTPKGSYRGNKALIAAQYAGVKIETPNFQLGKDDKTPAFKELNPIGKVPVLETDHGVIFESNAIARYVARLRNDIGLYGATFQQSGQVDSWVDFCTHELEVPLCTWVYPVQKIIDEIPEATARAKEDVKSVLKVLNDHLLLNTFIVGEQITLADICLVSALTDAWKLVFTADFVKPFPNVVRWFETCVHQPEFHNVIGDVKLAGAAATAAVKPGTAPAKAMTPRDKPQPAPKAKEQPKPAPAAPKPAAAEDYDDDDEDGGRKKPKEANPLDLLPPSKMVLDEWKRTYSNTKDLYGTAMKWFWEHYDAQGYCLYFVKYNKAEGEGKVSYMTCNLLSGFLQRLDKLRKYAFGVMDVVGTNGNFDIEGAWLFRGSEIPFEMKDHPSFEFHTWTPIKLTDPKAKKLLEDYWCAGETVNGKPIVDSKVFK